MMGDQEIVCNRTWWVAMKWPVTGHDGVAKRLPIAGQSFQSERPLLFSSSACFCFYLNSQWLQHSLSVLNVGFHHCIIPWALRQASLLGHQMDDWWSPHAVLGSVPFPHCHPWDISQQGGGGYEKNNMTRRRTTRRSCHAWAWFWWRSYHLDRIGSFFGAMLCVSFGEVIIWTGSGHFFVLCCVYHLEKLSSGPDWVIFWCYAVWIIWRSYHLDRIGSFFGAMLCVSFGEVIIWTGSGRFLVLCCVNHLEKLSSGPDRVVFLVLCCVYHLEKLSSGPDRVVFWCYAVCIIWRSYHLDRIGSFFLVLCCVNHLEKLSSGPDRVVFWCYAVWIISI